MPSSRKAERRKTRKRKPRPTPTSEKYAQYYKRECNSIDTRTFPQVKSQVLQYLKDERCPTNVKIMFGDWMFRKIYMMYKFQEEARNEVCDDLSTAIHDCDETVIKGEYLQFHDYLAVNELASNFYVNRFDDQDKYFILQMLNDTELAKGIVQREDLSEEEVKEHFIRWLKQSPILEQQSNLLDVLLRYYNGDEEVNDIFRKMRFGKAGMGTLYEDEQNVHDEDINVSVLGAMARLISYIDDIRHEDLDEEPRKRRTFDVPENISYKDFMDHYLGRIYKDQNSRMICEAVVSRSCIDTTSFSGENEQGATVNFTIAEGFMALLNYIHIKKLEDKTTATSLYEILLEEMEAMAELCASGYIARFINVLRGFDERFEANITFEKQLYAVLSKVISDKMTSASENVIAGTFEKIHQPEYISYLTKIIEEQIPRLYHDYGAEDIEMYLAHTLSDITGLEGWRYQNRRLSFEVEEESSSEEGEEFEEM